MRLRRLGPFLGGPGRGVCADAGRAEPAGGKRLHDFITGDIENNVGGKFAWTSSPDEQVKLILEHIDRKREVLGITAKRERKLFGMKERRELDV